jgi:hypothetical protein
LAAGKSMQEMPGIGGSRARCRIEQIIRKERHVFSFELVNNAL